MPPLRGSRAARANRGQTDVDIMEGLPVRQWRKQPAVMNKNPQRDAQTEIPDKNTRWHELPMPKGSDLYPPWSQALLRAARAGRILQRNSKANVEDKDGAEDEDAEGDIDTSFVANKWNQLPREAEEAEAEYLAKRRKGLPTLYGGWATDGANVTMRKCKVKKIDSEGNPYLLEVLIPEGTTIDGEVEEHEDLPIQAPAAGTVIEGLGLANAEGVIVANEHMMPTPPRRRPPIPKRKPKGPGRGRKKKVIIEDGTDGTATAVNATTTTGSGTTGANNLDPNNPDANGQADGSVNADGDGEGDGDGDDGSEDDEDDGEDGDDNDREDGEMSDGEDASRSASPVKPVAKSSSPLKTDISGSLLETPVVIPEVQVTPAVSDNDQDQPEVASESQHPTETEPISTADDAVAAPDADIDTQMMDAPVSPDKKVVEDEDPAPVVDPVHIEEPMAQTTAEIEAKLPEEHNPLEGLTEPQTAPAEEVTPASEEKDEQGHKEDSSTVVTEVVESLKTEIPPVDPPIEPPIETEEMKQESSTAEEKPVTGEDDIFGSLERHLDGKDKPE